MIKQPEIESDERPAQLAKSLDVSGTGHSTVQDNSSGKRINDWGPWLTLVAIVAAFALGSYLGVLSSVHAVAANLEKHEIEERSEENKQTSQMWRIDNHLRDMEIAQGVMKETLEKCYVRR